LAIGEVSEDMIAEEKVRKEGEGTKIYAVVSFEK